MKAAMFDVLRFWLQKGVDGFRVDVMWMIIKDDHFRDNPPNPGYHAGLSSNHQFLPVYNSNRSECMPSSLRCAASSTSFPIAY